MKGGTSSSESSDWDDVEYILRQQAVFISDKTIITTVTSHPEHVSDWIFDTTANPLRLIVGIDIKLDSPDHPLTATSAPPHRPVALLLLCVYRTCLIFELTYATKIPTSLSRFLSDHNYTFVDVGIEPKLLQLRQEFCLGGRASYFDLGHVTAARYRRPELRNAGISELRTFFAWGRRGEALAAGGWELGRRGAVECALLLDLGL
ncbi:hypothetical protein ACS0TY_023502 [Phlomoides rotata]